MAKPIRRATLRRALERLLRADAHGLHGDVSWTARPERFGQVAHAEDETDVRVLLAEDNVVNQKVALRMLERLGYRTQVAANGVEALELLRAGAYALVFMDVQMPEMDGLEVTRQLRALPIEQPWVVAMTANAMHRDRGICMEAGMDDYLAKPVRLEALHEVLQRFERQRTPGNELDWNPGWTTAKSADRPNPGPPV
jgi:CheY-like chemotaxis protein